ncbi:MAG: HORMA domain-containing protein 1 [Paramarteilia canceri]
MQSFDSKSCVSNLSWKAIFPQEQSTEKHSNIFTKKLLALAVSNVLYLRSIFPEAAFVKRNSFFELQDDFSTNSTLEDGKSKSSFSCGEDSLRVLKGDDQFPAAAQIVDWLKSCFEAIDKRYLKSISLGICSEPNKTDSTIEAYTFEIFYENDSKEAKIFVKNKSNTNKCTIASDSTKKMTSELFKTLIVLTQSLPDLPDQVFLSMRLEYYEELTPANYQPSGFNDCDSNFKVPKSPITVRTGKVSTNFHSINCKVRTSSNSFEDEEDQRSKQSNKYCKESSNVSSNPSKKLKLSDYEISHSQNSYKNIKCN